MISVENLTEKISAIGQIVGEMDILTEIISVNIG
jgi:hypothetical protein